MMKKIISDFTMLAVLVLILFIIASLVFNKTYEPIPMVSTSKKHYQGFEYPKPVAQVSPDDAELTVKVATRGNILTPNGGVGYTGDTLIWDELACEHAYVLFIEFEGFKKWREWIKNTPAKHKADVHIEYEGEIKEFTFDEFFSKLGWSIND